MDRSFRTLAWRAYNRTPPNERGYQYAKRASLRDAETRLTANRKNRWWRRRMEIKAGHAVLPWASGSAI